MARRGVIQSSLHHSAWRCARYSALQELPDRRIAAKALDEVALTPVDGVRVREDGRIPLADLARFHPQREREAGEQRLFLALRLFADHTPEIAGGKFSDNPGRRIFRHRRAALALGPGRDLLARLAARRIDQDTIDAELEVAQERRQ